MLQIKNLTIYHKRDLHMLLKDFSFVLKDGEKAALIGEEGNGKSTLLKLIYNPVLIEDYAEYSGEIITGKTVFGYLPQELSEREKALSVTDFLTENGFFELPFGDGADLCSNVGIEYGDCWREQNVGSLSGGEKVKLSLLAALCKRPDVLLLDEPSNDIDIETLEWLERFINTCDLSVMYISHDETLLENTATAIIHMEQLRKKTVPRATAVRMGYAEYVRRRAELFEHREQMAQSDRREFDEKMERFRHIRDRVEHEQNAISRGDPHGGAMLKKKMHTVVSIGRRFEKEKEQLTAFPESEDAILLRFGEGSAVPRGKTVLKLDLPVLKAGERTLAENIHLEVRGGEHICITGKNGTGKTTLLRLAAAELLSRSDIAAAYMPQNYADLLPQTKTPTEFLCAGGSGEERTRARSYLSSMRFTREEAERPIAELSGGQKAKLFFAKFALGSYNVLILDEPTRNLSPLSGPEVRAVLKSFGGTVISVSHDRKYIAETSTRVLKLTPRGLSE